MSLSAGTRLGPYEIVAPLGAGGMGEVYRARDPRMGREVAVAAPCIRAEPLSRARNALFIDELKLDRACDRLAERSLHRKTKPEFTAHTREATGDCSRLTAYTEAIHLDE